MGFESERVEWALHATNNAGLQPAMDHLVENSEKPIPQDWRSQSASASASAGAGSANADVSSTHLQPQSSSNLLFMFFSF